MIFSLFSKSFSNNFDIIGSKDIGLYGVVSWGGLPGFGGHGGLWGCEMLRIPHCVDSRLTHGGEVVRLTYWLRFVPQKHFLVPISVKLS
jgi:hypothetical protein